MSITRIEADNKEIKIPIRRWEVNEFDDVYMIIEIDDSDSSLRIEQTQGSFWMWLDQDGSERMLIDEAITALTEARNELQRLRA